jgi:hypothetical protein
MTFQVIMLSKKRMLKHFSCLSPYKEQGIAFFNTSKSHAPPLILTIKMHLLGYIGMGVMKCSSSYRYIILCLFLNLN